MPSTYTMSLSTALLALLLSLHNDYFLQSCSGRVFTDPHDETQILEGATLLPYCWSTTQQCETHFGKNVFATENPIMDRLWTEALFPDMYNQFDDNFDTCGFGSKFISMDSCSQLHAPMTTYHDEGGLSVDYVQQRYAAKWAHVVALAREEGVGAYDAFLDNSVAYWVDDLAAYQGTWEAANAEIIYLRWRVTSTDKYGDRWFYSMITHNGNSGHSDGGKYRTGSTLSQYELISDTFSSLDDGVVFVDMEQRAYFDDSTDYAGLGSGCQLYPIGARRAVSDVRANVAWYQALFGATIVDPGQVAVEETTDASGARVAYAHVKLHSSEVSATISFFERGAADATHGEFTVAEFEAALAHTHETVMLNPFCGIDRWFDMHYAVDFDDVAASEQVFEAVMLSGNRYTLYGDNKEHFLYVPEPNGHSIQVVFENSYDISMDVAPFAWTWCQRNCSKNQSAFAYGDRIFEWDEKTTFGRQMKASQLAREAVLERADADGLAASVESMVAFLQVHLVLLALVAGVGLIGAALVCCSAAGGKWISDFCNCNGNKYHSLQ